MSLRVDFPADALRRLEAEATRRGIGVEQVLVELAEDLPNERTPDPASDTGSPSGHRLSFVGIGRSGDTRPFDIHRERAELAERKYAEGI